MTLSELTVQLDEYVNGNPQAGDYGVVAIPKFGSAGQLSLRNRWGRPDSWNDIDVRFRHPDDLVANRSQMGPYHPRRRKLVPAIPDAYCRYFTYSGDQIAELEADRFEQIFYGHSLPQPLWPDGDFPVATARILPDERHVSVYFARFAVESGIITNESLYAAWYYSRLDMCRDGIHEAMPEPSQRTKPERYMYAAWPTDWIDQIGHALHLPSNSISDAGLYGPLIYAYRNCVRVRVALHMTLSCRRWEKTE